MASVAYKSEILFDAESVTVLPFLLTVYLSPSSSDFFIKTVMPSSASNEPSFS